MFDMGVVETRKPGMLAVYDAGFAEGSASNWGLLFTRIGAVPDASSIQWLEHYQDVGEAQIICPPTATNMDVLVPGNTLVYESDVIMIILETEQVILGAAPQLVVRAKPFAWTLDTRVVMGTSTIDSVASVASCIMTNHRDNGLRLNVDYSDIASIPVEFQQSSWGSVLEYLVAFSARYNTGFKSRLYSFSPAAELQAELYMYQGVDRSNQADPNTYNGYFGDDLDTISQAKIVRAVHNYRNAAVVAGEGEGAARKVVTVSTGTFYGYDRKELYVDARDLGLSYTKMVATGATDDQGNPLFTQETGTYTAAQYTSVLQARGLEKLTEYNRKFDVSIDVTDTILRFREDYNLGDIVPIMIKSAGLSLSARVISVQTVVDDTAGYRNQITLSDFKEIN